MKVSNRAPLERPPSVNVQPRNSFFSASSSSNFHFSRSEQQPVHSWELLQDYPTIVLLLLHYRHQNYWRRFSLPANSKRGKDFSAHNHESQSERVVGVLNGAGDDGEH